MISGFDFALFEVRNLCMASRLLDHCQFKMPGKCKFLNKWRVQPQYHAWLRNSRVGENRRTWLEQKRTDGYVIVSINEPCLSQCPSRKYYFVVVQLAIEIYSLPVSTANGIKFSFIRQRLEICLFILSDRHVPICNRNSYT